MQVAPPTTRREAEELSGLWQTGLANNHIEVDRFMIEDDRCLLLFKDGALAWEGLDWLLSQEKCLEIQLEQKTYHGYHTEEGKKEKAEKEAKLKKQEAEKAKKAKKEKKPEKKAKKKSKNKKEEL